MFLLHFLLYLFKQLLFLFSGVHAVCAALRLPNFHGCTSHLCFLSSRSFGGLPLAFLLQQSCSGFGQFFNPLQATAEFCGKAVTLNHSKEAVCSDLGPGLHVRSFWGDVFARIFFSLFFVCTPLMSLSLFLFFSYHHLFQLSFPLTWMSTQHPNAFMIPLWSSFL